MVTHPVKARPYHNDRTLWHVDMMIPCSTDSQRTIRKRLVAPAGLTLEGALAWGEAERLRIVMEKFKVPGGKEGEAAEQKELPKKEIPTLKELWIEFESHWIARQKVATQSGYVSAWARHIKDVLGDLPLDRIDLEALCRLRTQLEDRKLLPQSQQKVIAKVHKALTWAMRRGKIPFAPIPSMDFDAPPPKKHMPIYTPGDLERVLAAGSARTLYKRVLVLLCTDGALRIGECAGLAWSKIDWLEKTMLIDQNVCHGVLQDTPKGEIGKVPLTPRLESALRELAAIGHPTWVLGRSRGETPFARDSGLQKQVAALELAAGLPARGPHWIRHSRLTHLAESGVRPYALQAFARHASMETTMGYYVHLDRLRQAREAVSVIAALTPSADTTPIPSGNDQATWGNEAGFEPRTLN